MSKVVRIICLLMVLAMIVSVSACGGEGDVEESTTTTGSAATTTTKATTTTTTGEQDPFAEHYELLYMGGGVNDPATMEANKLVELTIEEMFNIDLSFSPCPYYNKPNEFNLIVAAGALADFGFTCLTVKAPEMNQKGVIRDIMKADVERLMPNYIEKMKDWSLMLAWQTKNDEAYYALYETTSVGSGGGFCTGVRLDWMENLGMTPKGNVTRLVPEGATVTNWASDEDEDADQRMFVTDYQYSWDEFLELLRGFALQDPDQNGEDDTYGLSTNILEFMDGYYGFHIFPIQGMNFRWVEEPDGSAAPQRYSLVYKEFLEMHKALDDEGLLIPEYWSAIYSDVWQYWATGKAGAVAMVTGYLGGSTLPPYSILYENPDAKALMLPPTQGRRGLDSQFMGGSDIGYLFVNANVTDGEYERILQILDWMWFSDEGREFCYYGVEGQNFTFDEDGKYVPNTAEQNDELAPEKRVATGIYAMLSWFYWERPFDLNTRTGLMYQYEKDNWPELEGYYVFYGPGAADALSSAEFDDPENNDAKEAAYKEYVLDICEGKMDSDTAYEKMMSVMNSMGYQEYLQVVNESMYLTEELLKGNFVHPVDR